jgi:hypothetical protein
LSVRDQLSKTYKPKEQVTFFLFKESRHKLSQLVEHYKRTLPSPGRVNRSYVIDQLINEAYERMQVESTSKASNKAPTLH